MTIVMRTNGLDGHNAPATGPIEKGETCVAVQWEWVIFPSALVLLALLFFVAMVVQTRPTDVTSNHDYKSSALALLFLRLEPQTQMKELEGLGNALALGKQAKEVYVKLGPSDKGWRFVESAPKQG